MRIKTYMFTACLSTVIASSASAIELQVPIACELGVDCIIQNYMDHDPGKGWRDYKCGHMSYDGHKGTDFRIRSMKDMETGVNVLAATGGVVKALRDGMADIDYKKVDAKLLAGKECGNGIVVTHDNGWKHNTATSSSAVFW